MKVLETDRLILRRLTVDDAELILDLLTQPSYLRFIGDKRVRTPLSFSRVRYNPNPKRS